MLAALAVVLVNGLAQAKADGQLDGLLVVELSGDQLEVVRVHGRIDDLLEAAGSAVDLPTALGIR